MFTTMINDSSACRRLSCSLALCTRWQVQRGPSGNCFNFPDIVTSVSCTQHTHVYQPGWSVIFFFYPHRKGDEKDLKSVSTAQLLWVDYILLCRKQFGFQPWVEKHKVEQEQKKFGIYSDKNDNFSRVPECIGVPRLKLLRDGFMTCIDFWVGWLCP